MEYLCATYWIQLMFLTVTSLTVHCYIIRHNSYYALIPYPTMLNFCHRIVHTCAYFCYRMIVLVQMIRFFNTRGEMFLWHKSSFQLLVYRVFFFIFPTEYILKLTFRNYRQHAHQDNMQDGISHCRYLVDNHLGKIDWPPTFIDISNLFLDLRVWWGFIVQSCHHLISQKYRSCIYTTSHGWKIFSYVHTYWNVLKSWHVFKYSVECEALFYTGKEYLSSLIWIYRHSFSN